MATQLLGEQLDIHCGGVDNIFPHHEAEIAQTEGCTGKKFVRYWVHCEHLMVEGQKMSKSLGNFYTLRDILAKGYSGREVRYALMRIHYRAPLNFTWKGMDGSRQALNRIDDWLDRLRTRAGENLQTPNGNSTLPPESSSPFEEALDDNLNISKALGFLFDAINETNRALDLNQLDSTSASSWLQWWRRINSVLEIEPVYAGADQVNGIPADIAAMADARVQARLAKDWRKSDELRDQLADHGWEVRDTKDGQKIVRRAGV
jgi:cysteinyl-tRNA synthetase